VPTGWLVGLNRNLHSQTFEELKAMAKTAGREPKFRLKPLVEWMGYKEAIEQLDSDRVIEQLVMDEKKKRKILARLGKNLSPAKRAELIRLLFNSEHDV
jgi:hypothetical protein